MENKYVRRSYIAEAKIRQIVKCFALDLAAAQTAEKTLLNRKTVDRVYSLIRARRREYACETPPFTGELEADESCFGLHRVKWKRERGAGGKAIVFGLHKRDGKAEIVPYAAAHTLQKINTWPRRHRKRHPHRQITRLRWVWLILGC